MSSQTSFDLTGLSRAIQRRDFRYHLALYAADAEVKIYDWDQPDTPMQVLRGKSAISEWLEAMTSTAVHYKVRDALVHPDRVTYTEECRYDDGSSLQFQCSAEVRSGQITSATVTLVHVPRSQASPQAAQRTSSEARERPTPANRPHRSSSRPATGRHLAGNWLG